MVRHLLKAHVPPTKNCPEPKQEVQFPRTGSAEFISEIRDIRVFKSFSEEKPNLIRLQGQQLTVSYLTEHGFDKLILVEKKEGLEMLVPPENFTIQNVEEHVGSEQEICVTDAREQTVSRMRLREFVNHYMTPPAQRTRTLTALIEGDEFSRTGLGQMIHAPEIVRKMDWVNEVWPNDLPDDTELRKPKPQIYCLMGTKNSYTDFRVVSSGSSVWYHVFKGQKILYLMEPTETNLSTYYKWMKSSNRSHCFLGDQIFDCYKFIINEGETLLIPAGWIHAALTPVDSVIFGGNFFHSLNIKMQLEIYKLENKHRISEMFRFQAFETTNWYAARKLANELREMNSKGLKYPRNLLQEIKTLITTLKQWICVKGIRRTEKYSKKLGIQIEKILSDLGKEVRIAGQLLNSNDRSKLETEELREELGHAEPSTSYDVSREPQRKSERKRRKPNKYFFMNFSKPQLRSKVRKDEIPKSTGIQNQTLLKNSGKELGHAEPMLSSFNPPGTERKSASKRKKSEKCVQPQSLEEPRSKVRKDEMPINRPTQSETLQKNSGKELRHAEPMLSSFNPPGTERKSASKRKKSEKCVQPQSLEEPVTMEEPLNLSSKARMETEPTSPCTPLDLTMPKNQNFLPVALDLTVPKTESAPCEAIDLTVLKAETNVKNSGPLPDSVYDFHEESDEDIPTLDELRKRRRHIPKPFSSLKLLVPNTPRNGIEEASGNPLDFSRVSHDMAGMPSTSRDFISELESSNDGLKSPPLREEIQFSDDNGGNIDTLSQDNKRTPNNGTGEVLEELGRPCCSHKTPSILKLVSSRVSHDMNEMPSTSRDFIPKQGSSKESPCLQRKKVQFSNDNGEDIKIIRQNNETYLLLVSSDDEDLICTPKRKKDADDTWKPSSRVGQLLLKSDLPKRKRKQKIRPDELKIL